MTTDHDLDRQIQDYLRIGPVELSDRVLWAARAQISTTRRRGRLDRLAPWRDHSMSQSMRLLLTGAAALVVVVALGTGVLGPLFGQHQTGPGSSMAPSAGVPSPSAPAASSSATPAPRPSPTFTAAIVSVAPAAVVAPAWTVTGTPATTFGTPVLAPDGRIWVPANEPDVIRIYSATGKLVETWGTPGSGTGQFDFGDVAAPDRAGIVFAPDGSFFVLDSSNYRVQRYSRDRRYLSTFGSYGSDDGHFVAPIAIGLDDAANVYVSDAVRNDVQVFTTGGAYIGTVAKGAAGDSVWGSGPGWFITTRLTNDGSGVVEYHSDGTIQGGWDLTEWGCEPAGVTRDQAPRNIYLTCANQDGGPGYLLRFDQTGTLLRAWKLNGRGVAVTPDGSTAFVLSEDQASLTRYDLGPA